MKIAALIEIALKEDLGTGDITSQSIFSNRNKIATAHVFAKQDGVICGIDFFIDTFKQVDDTVEIDVHKSNGYTVKSGDKILSIKGPIISILSAERTALNFLGRLSGISTLTNQFVQKVSHTNAIILDTRKTLPAYRYLEKFAVRIGGGENHRIGLYDMVLIKDNHIDAAGSISNAIKEVKTYLKENNRDQMKIEIEVKNIAELKEALQFDIDRIMLDNMDIDTIKECVQITDKRVDLEASGNVSLDTVKSIAETGVDYISVGMITHSAKNFDFSMRIDK